MTAHAIRRTHAGFEPDDDWTDSAWQRARHAAGLRAERETATDEPLPGDLIRFRGGQLDRLASLDGALLALPTAEDETHFKLTGTGDVVYTAYLDSRDGMEVCPDDVVATDEVGSQYTAFAAFPDVLGLRYLWMPARIWDVRVRAETDIPFP